VLGLLAVFLLSIILDQLSNHIILARRAKQFTFLCTIQFELVLIISSYSRLSRV